MYIIPQKYAPARGHRGAKEKVQMSPTSLAAGTPANDIPASGMAERRLYGAEAVSALYAWLRCRESDELPRLRDIAEQAGITSHYVVWLALATLMRQGRITLRHGTRSLHRGHQAIRVLATGRVLKTAGCPFEAPVFVGDVGL